MLTDSRLFPSLPVRTCTVCPNQLDPTYVINSHSAARSRHAIYAPSSAGRFCPHLCYTTGASASSQSCMLSIIATRARAESCGPYCCGDRNNPLPQCNSVGQLERKGSSACCQDSAAPAARTLIGTTSDSGRARQGLQTCTPRVQLNMKQARNTDQPPSLLHLAML